MVKKGDPIVQCLGVEKMETMMMENGYVDPWLLNPSPKWDYDRDPNIKALTRRGFVNHASASWRRTQKM